MKTKEELNALKEEYTELNKKLAQLTEEELKQVVGGIDPEGSLQKIIGDWSINVKLKDKYGNKIKPKEVNIQLNGYNYEFEKSGIIINPPDREYEEDKRSLFTELEK